MAKFFYHDDQDTQQNFMDEHNSGIDVSKEKLAELGVLYFNITNTNDLNKLSEERHYKSRDEIILNMNSFDGDVNAFNTKMASFYKEHYHEDEEIRYIVEGEGYFDVRDSEDKWIRANLYPNDLIILPAGIYHRFTLTTSKKHIKTIRLFQGEPKWEAINRDTDNITDARSKYMESIKV